MNTNPLGFWENIEEVFNFLSCAKAGIDYTIWFTTQYIIDTSINPNTYFKDCFNKTIPMYNTLSLSEYLRFFYQNFSDEDFIVINNVHNESLSKLVELFMWNETCIWNQIDVIYGTLLITCYHPDYYQSFFDYCSNLDLNIYDNNVKSEQRFLSDLMYVDATLYDTYQKRSYPHHQYFTRGWRSANIDATKYPYWGWSFFHMPFLHNHNFLNYLLESKYLFKDYLFSKSVGQEVVYIYDYMQTKVPNIKMKNWFFFKMNYYNDSMNKHDFLHHDYKNPNILSDNFYIDKLKNSYFEGIYGSCDPFIWRGERQHLKGLYFTYYDCFGSPEPRWLNTFSYLLENWLGYWNKTYYNFDEIKTFLNSDSIKAFSRRGHPIVIYLDWVVWDEIKDNNTLIKKILVKEKSNFHMSFDD